MSFPDQPTDITIIPALPGYYVIYSGKGEESVDNLERRDAVIAWRVTTHVDKDGDCVSYQHPITLDNEPSCLGLNDWAVLRPDGCVQEPVMSTHSSVADYLASVRERYA